MEILIMKSKPPDRPQTLFEWLIKWFATDIKSLFTKTKMVETPEYQWDKLLSRNKDKKSVQNWIDADEIAKKSSSTNEMDAKAKRKLLSKD